MAINLPKSVKLKMWGHKLRSVVNWLRALRQKDVQWGLGVCGDDSDCGELNLMVTLYWFVRIYYPFKGLADGKKHMSEVWCSEW